LPAIIFNTTAHCKPCMANRNSYINKDTLIAAAITVMLFACGTSKKTAGSAAPAKPAAWVKTLHDSLHIQTYKSAVISSRPNLVIVIHGDAPFNNPGYQYVLAKMLAAENSNTIAVGLLRPGYTDPNNNKSPGKKGLTTGDNYTAPIVDDIAAAITNLKTLYNPGKTIIAGHSGGSAITADVISRHPGIADGAAIVSCPCNVAEWRAHMKALQKDTDVWDRPVNSLSPNDLVQGIDSKTKIVVVTGEKDNVAPTVLSNNYYAQLKQRNLNAELIIIKGAGHEIFLTDSVRQAIGALIK